MSSPYGYAVPSGVPVHIGRHARGNVARMVRVVLDTNVVGGKKSRPMETNDLRRLIDETRQGKLQVVVPEIVVREASNLWAAVVRDDLHAFNRAQARLIVEGVIEAETSTPSFGFEAFRLAEADRIRKLVRDAGGVVAPLPAAGHDAFVSRALDRLKPYDTHGRNGYRDVLLWETILEIVDADEPIVFIAKDVAAFHQASGNPVLAQVLADEATARSGTTNVTLCPDLAEGILEALRLHALTEEAAQAEQAAAAAADAEALTALNSLLARDGPFSTLLHDAVEEALRSWNVTSDLDAFGIHAADAYDASIDIVDAIEDLTFISGHVTSDGTVLAEVEARASATADLSLHPSSASELEGHPQVRIYDFGLGTHRADGVVDVTGDVVADVVVDLEHGELASLATVSRFGPVPS